MNVVVNGRGRSVPEETTVADLLREMDLAGDGKGLAVAVNAEVVRRAAWVSVLLREGDRVDVIRAVQGG